MDRDDLPGDVVVVALTLALQPVDGPGLDRADPSTNTSMLSGLYAILEGQRQIRLGLAEHLTGRKIKIGDTRYQVLGEVIDR